MTMKGVAPPEVSMLDIFRAVVPFLAMSVLLLALVFLVPGIATWLPSLIG
jgi:TRAP-type mannitol/chloroaromatic compound transport system permease large subunit